MMGVEVLGGERLTELKMGSRWSKGESVGEGWGEVGSRWSSVEGGSRSVGFGVVGSRIDDLDRR